MMRVEFMQHLKAGHSFRISTFDRFYWPDIVRTTKAFDYLLAEDNHALFDYGEWLIFDDVFDCYLDAVAACVKEACCNGRIAKYRLDDGDIGALVYADYLKVGDE